MGDLKEHRYSDALWLRGGFSQISSSASTLRVGLGELGYDHAFVPSIGQDFLGVNFEYSYSWLDTPSNTANTYGATLYNTYLAPNGFYIDTRVKYLYLSPTSRLTYTVDNASLFADFTYGQNIPAQATVNVRNSGTWFVGQSNTIETLTITNPEDNLNRDNFEKLTNLASVDFRFSDKGVTLRSLETINDANRFILKTNSIGSNGGAGGVFRLFGVFNTAGWTEVRDQNNQTLQETIATDQIQTNQLNGTHHIQLFWDRNSFDKSLLNTDLEPKKIIVAKQFQQTGGSNFVGAVTPIGVYNYITNLKRENFTWMDNNGMQNTGTQWIIADVQRADNSYMSRLLDSIFQTQFRIYKTQIDTLNLRMGELRKLNRVHGVWLRSK